MDRYPELVAAAELLPDGTVLDGEVMPWKDDAAMAFAQLQRRIGRKKLGPKILAEVPVVLIAYDLLELNGVGRRKGSWWKWKVRPFSMDAVMIYAQPGHGRRALLHTDYTFAVRDGDALVLFAKAYSGLTDVEIRQLDAWIRRHTIEKFGPVRQVGARRDGVLPTCCMEVLPYTPSRTPATSPP